MFVPKAGMSNVWRGITENSKILCEGMRMAVGNGDTTLFWDHKWAANTPLSELITQPIPTELEGATVGEMWEAGQGWRWEIFSPYLPHDTLKLIQSHELKEDHNIGDLVYWQDGTKGKFSIKSAIRIMRHETDTLDEACWDAVWRAPVQQRIRAFLWLSCHDRILGNLNRFKRHMTDATKCFICDAPEESTLHIIRECPAARMVWRKLGGPASSPTFFQSDLKDWITDNLKGTAADHDAKWPTHFGIAVWWIWKWRNCFVFGKQHEIPIDIGAFLQVRVDETYQSLQGLETYHGTNHGPRIQTYVRWKFPHDVPYVLNCDGAAKGSPGPAGGGAIIRNQQGTHVSSLAANFGHCTAFKAELFALLNGLKLAGNLKIKALEVQLDSQACVQVMQDTSPAMGECAHVINDCRSMLNNPEWRVTVVHIYREGNRAADWLANFGVAQNVRFHMFQSVPLELSRILDEDIRGVAFPRQVPP